LIHLNMSDAEYSALPGIRSTQLKRALLSPKHFMAPVDGTDATQLGTLVHMYCLEPERFKKECAVEPSDIESKTKNPGKKKWDEFKAANADKTIVTREQFTVCEGIWQSIQDHPTARFWFQDAAKEVVATAKLGLNDAKAKADLVMGSILADLKTTSGLASPGAWSKTVAEYGYHFSAAYYRDVFRAAGRDVSLFFWVVAETKAPYAVRIFQAAEAALTKGRMEYEEALARIRTAQDLDMWDSYPTDIVPIDLPSWYKSAADYT